MSGHSRWSQIKRKKGKTDVQRGKLFSKILREITVAARNGGGDAKVNMRLKAAMESAKEANMPHENIKRAIQKGTGELPGESYEEITYEGYASGGVAIMIRVLTDNRNRTAPEIRHTFEKHGGNMGASGAVAWMFDRKGIIQIDAGKVAEDDLLGLARRPAPPTCAGWKKLSRSPPLLLKWTPCGPRSKRPGCRSWRGRSRSCRSRRFASKGRTRHRCYA